jgi:hypothetical protein
VYFTARPILSRQIGLTKSVVATLNESGVRWFKRFFDDALKRI